MNSSSPTPLSLLPVPVARPWGGARARRIADLPPTTSRDPIGEWWLVSTRDSAASRVAHGVHAGRALPEVLAEQPLAWLGPAWESWLRRFPLLVKLLDAEDVLSVQLHPSDAVLPGEGKTESWLILDAAPGAAAYLGLRHGDAAAFFDEAAAGRNPAARLDRRPLSTGDVVHVPAGLIHALGGPVVALEVQQNSDTTYRIHDWDREPRRALHLAAARAAVRPDQRAVLPLPRVLQETPFRRESLVHCGAYTMERLDLDGTTEFATDPTAFQILIPLSDGARIEGDFEPIPAPRGHACLIPTACRYEVTCRGPSPVIRLLPPTPPSS